MNFRTQQKYAKYNKRKREKRDLYTREQDYERKCKNMKENTWACMEQKLQRRVLNTY